MTHELRDLHITKIALVRKGWRPVNDGARITIVKAQEDTMSDDKAAEASVLARISKALAGLLKGDTEVEVEKAAPKVSADELNISPDGSHGPVDGTHSHSHTSHYAVMMHEHSHGHDGDSDHYHGHVVKADQEHPALTDGWKEVSPEELRTMLGDAEVGSADVSGEAVAKAIADGVDGKLKPLQDEIATLTAQLAEAREQVSKAAPADEHTLELIDQKLEPITKAIEDFAVAFARLPRTPNVTKDIQPGAASANGEVDLQAVQNMDFPTATRHLLHRQA